MSASARIEPLKMSSNMDDFVAPITHAWFHQNSIISTPDNGVLYCSRYDVAYIPPVESNCLPKTHIMTNQGFIKSLACSPDWTNKRLFATLDEHRNLYVWDLDLQRPVHGHRGHVTGPKGPRKQFFEVTSAVCFSAHGKVISCDRSDLVVYCLLTDTYKESLDFFRNKTVVTLVRSPLDSNVFFAGMKDGLIHIFSIKKMAILHSLRGHDKEIVSIECMTVPVFDKSGWRKQGKIKDGTEDGAESGKKKIPDRPKKQARQKTLPVPDESDFFDIYDFNESQEKFGTIIDREAKDDSREQFREKTKTVEGFNFLEACENLKEDILKAATRREEDDEDENDDGTVERSHIVQEDFNTDDENELDDCEKLRDYVVVDKEQEDNPDLDVDEDETERKLILVSGSRENTIWFWDYDTGLPIDKIVVPCVANARLCDTLFTNVVWLDESHIVANNSNGQVIEWKVDFAFRNDRLQLEAKTSLAPYPVEKIFHIIRANGLAKTDTNGRYIWCSSIYRKLVCLEVTEAGKASVVLDYGCLNPTNRYLIENPLESMVIVIASGAPRIEIMNLANLQHDNILFKSSSNKIGGPVISVAWHPEDEEKLAFGTKEGRIGVIDTSNPSNIPMVLKSFTNKEVYCLQWCYLTNEKQEKRLVLFACGKVKLAYYHMTGSQKYELIECRQFGHVSNVSAVDNLCFFGTQDGSIIIADLNNNMKELYRKKIAKRYICALEYKKTYLAVASFDSTIRVINFENGFDDEKEQQIIALEGHTEGICKLRWSRSDTMRIVSCSFDCTIRVWDALSATCLKVYHTGSYAFAAMFSPLDENLILYTGKGISLGCFDYTKQHVARPKASEQAPNIKFATREDTKQADMKKGKISRSSHNTKAQGPVESSKPDESVDLLADGMEKVSLKAATVQQTSAYLSTTFPLTHREANRTKNVLDCIVKLLHTPDPEPEPEPAAVDENSDEYCSEEEMISSLKPKKTVPPAPIEPEKKQSDEVDNEPMFYNEKLFSTEDKLKQLIEEEAKLHSITETSSIGLVMMPQLLHKLKETILGCISKKKLTSHMLALAPYVSHMFWRQCCQAYAYQLIEGQEPLAAVPYFLASHKADSSIEELCDAKYFREAWVICRLQKMPDDPMLEQVASRWAHHLDATGNYEAAALVWTGVKKYKEAIGILEKRRDVTEDIQRTIDELNAKLQAVTSTDHK
uniref:WD repeat-containing protein 55 homolog n=1 Tax=Anopheles farauti TaxID=69004 RepID=A0A182Q7I2_9DIPT